MKQIVGILLVKNEDLHIEWVIRNVVDFCDHIIVLDNYSTDDTYAIIERLAANTDKIDLRKWKNPRTSQSVLSAYYGTDTWVFGVDGDEIYDPNDLSILRKRIFAGEFDRVWWLRGTFHNCVSLDLNAQIAQGYSAPPASGTAKLFNFKLISGWKNEHRRERLHGHPIFASGQSTVVLFSFVGDMSSWDGSQLKCLHLCFIARSSSGEFKQLFRLKHLKRRLFSKTSQIPYTVRANPHGDVAGRLKRYAVGEIVNQSISGLLGHVPEALGNSFTHPAPSLTEQLRQGGGLQLPVELRLANFDTLHCTQMLRLLPGKRAVMKAQWQGRTVLVKLLLNTASGARNAQREIAGYEILTAAKITTPKLLLKTRVDDKSHVLIFEFLQQERSLSELWRDHAEQRPQIARDCLQLIARMHAQACCQNDLHLDNFLLVDTQIYVIDFASVSHHATTVYGKWQRRNLALFLGSFAPLPRKILLDALQKSYPAAAVDDKLAHAIRRASQRSKSRYLKKCFRKCSEFSVRKNWREFAVWNRAYECEDLLSFVKNPEAWMAKGEFLKDGTSATVVRVTMTGMRGVHEKTVVIKRNNTKNIFHGLRNCLRATRSHINWRNVHLLKISGIETPAPIALVEKRWGPFRLRGYYVSEFNSFPTVAQKYESQVPGEDELMWFAEFFTGMRLARLYHGDLKASNLFVTDHGVAVIDYDSLKQCSEKNIHRFMYKDHQRFLRNWHDKPQHLKLFSMILGQGGA